MAFEELPRRGDFLPPLAGLEMHPACLPGPHGPG
jgi:hypothetical protein